MAPGPRYPQAFVSSAVLTVAISNFFPQFSVKGSYALTFITLLFVQLFSIFVWQQYIYTKLFSPLRGLPEPEGATWYNGHTKLVIAEPTGAPIRKWINEIPNDGLMRYRMFFNTERVLLCNPKALAEVLVTKSYDFVKPRLALQALGKILGFGILLVEGDEHKMQRRNLMPAFAHRHIKDLVPIFWQKSAELANRVTDEVLEKAKDEKETKTAVIAFREWIGRATLDIIGIAGMGCDFGALADPSSELNVTYRAIFNPSKQAQRLALLGQFLPIWFLRMLPLKRNADIAAAATLIRRVARETIMKKQKQIQEKGIDNVSKDIISVALKSGGFTVDSLVDNGMTFLAAGHETTSSATQWAMVALSMYPDMQKRLREEIRENLPSPSDASGRVTAEMLEECHYLQAFLNEILRFYAPVPLTRREALRDTTILGQFIPKGTAIILCPAAINLSKTMWGSDAEEFNPDRWMGKQKGSGGAVSNYANLTFLHGPRSCIGQQFSKTEFAALLAAIVGRFDIAFANPDYEVKVITGITSRPKDLDLKLTVLEGW